MVVGEKGTFSTGLALGEEYFDMRKEFNLEDSLSVLHSLLKEAGYLIEGPGIYEFRLEVSRIK